MSKAVKLVLFFIIVQKNNNNNKNNEQCNPAPKDLGSKFPRSKIVFKVMPSPKCV